MYNEYEYFDNTSNMGLTAKKVNSRSSHTVDKGKEIKMDLNPNKISTRFRKWKGEHKQMNRRKQVNSEITCHRVFRKRRPRQRKS